MKNSILTVALIAALASTSISSAHAGAATAPPASGSGSNSAENIVIAAFLIAVGTLIFGQGFGQKQRKVTKKSKSSEY